MVARGLSTGGQHVRKKRPTSFEKKDRMRDGPKTRIFPCGWKPVCERHRQEKGRIDHFGRQDP